MTSRTRLPRPAPPRLVVITAAAIGAPALFDRLERLALLAPAWRAEVAVQLRSPELPSADLYALGLGLRAQTSRLGALLFVNDRLDLARLLGADGVHLGRRSVSVADARAFLGERPLVSVACHAPLEVLGAAQAGADLATLSPIFPSPGKPPPLGLEALRAARALAPGLPVLALGGVDEGNAASCLAAGAHGVAAIRAEPAPTLLALSPCRTG